MTISEKVFKIYSEYGILARADDGVHPITLKELKESIKNIVLSESDISPNSDKTLNLGGLLPNNGPTYSASLLSLNKYPVLWYFFKYSDPFSSTKLPTLGKRTTLVVVLKSTSIFLHGMCLWDADSNDRDTGQIPNNVSSDKTIAQNDFASRKIFDGIGNYRFINTKSLNNFAWYNPLIRPETPESIAKTKEEITPFLKELGGLKEFWVTHLKNESSGFNDTWANYITNVYGSGVEAEVLTSPIYSQKSIFGKLKFSIDDIETMAFVTDGLVHNTQTIADYENCVRTFFNNKPGWLHRPSNEKINNIPIISIRRVALPNVNIDSMKSSEVGNNWLKYLEKGDTYQRPLELDDFKTIRESI
jgi:hypothetical protein